MIENFFKTKFVLLILPFLFACQTTETPRVVSDVTVFHSFYPEISETLYIKAAHQELDDSLEFAAYKKKFEFQFVQAGIQIVSEENVSDYVAVINYGIDDGTTTTQVGSVPLFGQTGGGYTTHSGSIYSGGGFGTYSGSSYSYPTFGVVGSSSYSYNVTTYKRVVTMDIFKKNLENQIEKVYEAKVSSTGSCGQIGEVIDEIIAALFSDFPGVSGSSETIEITLGADYDC